jgi:hypothetical protein
MGGAFVCFRAAIAGLLEGNLFYQKNIAFIFGIPDARMSSYPCFQHFHPAPSLDKRISGIPNAIMKRSRQGRADCRRTRK